MYTPRQGEADVYEELWHIAVPENSDVLGGAKAVEFFAKSGLDMGALKSIWTWSSPDAVMSKEQFFTALRYIAMSQNNENLSKGWGFVDPWWGPTVYLLV